MPKAAGCSGWRALGLAVVSASFLALGCEDPTPPAPRPTNPRAATPTFWRVEGAAGGELYLLGSIHVGPREGWILPGEVLAHFDRANTLFVEVDMRADSPEAQDDAVMRHALLPPGESIEDHISRETYEALAAHVTGQGRSMANIHPWKPWMVATMLLLEELQRLGYPTEAGVDLDLMNRAGKDKVVVGIETSEEQLSLLGGLSSENQELMLKDVLLQMQGLESHFEELMYAWRAGDTEALEALLFAELQRTPELAPFYEAVIYGRNQTMCERLEKQIPKQRPGFAVVGAAHLVGDRGIPACLSAKGHRVERVTAPAP